MLFGQQAEALHSAIRCRECRGCLRVPGCPVLRCECVWRYESCWRESYDVVHVGGVAAAHRDDDREPGGAAARQHQLIAAAQAVDRQLQTAQSIPFVRIGAREVEHQIGLVPVSTTSRQCARCARYGSSPVPSSSSTSRSLVSLRNG